MARVPTLYMLMTFHTAHLSAVKAIRDEWSVAAPPAFADATIPAFASQRAMWHLDQCDRLQVECDREFEEGD